MTTGISVREAGVEAIDEMMATMRQAFDPGYGEAWTDAQSLSMLGLPGVWLSLARLDDQPAGFALNRATFDETELLLLAVAPVFRRRGIGDSLIRRTKELSLIRNVDKVHLEVRHNNPALDLYIHAGFRIVGRRPGYYRGANGEIHDALTLSCSLIVA
ncbi:MAG: family N-acetyltransferase [Rhizorhabdus sp.]|nr:family N-acetyltransferase [Rhizorhabdus sp.]